jgi:hypothetical protein
MENEHTATGRMQEKRVTQGRERIALIQGGKDEARHSP